MNGYMTTLNLYNDADRNTMIAENRRGKFYIAWEIIRSADSKLVENLLSNFWIRNSEAFVESDTVEYWAYSLLFDPIEQDAIVPTYLIHVDSDFNVTAERITHD